MLLGLGGEDSLEKLLEAEQRAPALAAPPADGEPAPDLDADDHAVAIAVAEPPKEGDSGIYYQEPTAPGSIAEARR